MHVRMFGPSLGKMGDTGGRWYADVGILLDGGWTKLAQMVVAGIQTDTGNPI